MSRRAMPAIEVEPKRGSPYPEPLGMRMGDRVKRRLSDAFGLTQFGVNMVDIAPGGQSALRHWHTLEDELIYIIAGELVLVTDAGEQRVRAGDVVGFPGGDPDAHHFINKSSAPARYLEIGSRLTADVAHYPDDDAKWVEIDGEWLIVHKDGTPY